MKKTFRFLLMTATVCCLSLAATSCKDDENNIDNNGGGTEAVDDQTSLEEYQQRSIIAKLTGIDVTDIVLTKTYEPEIGVVDDESKPNVRSIAVGTVEKADETAVMLLSALGINANNPNGFTYSSDMVGTASYQHGGGDANTLATINLGLKHMPGLVQLRLTKTAGENSNPLPRYKVGDIVKYKNHYWVCVHEAGGYKDNAYFVTFDHTGDLHATSTFTWTPSWKDRYWQHDTPMADANTLGHWLSNCILTDEGWNKVKANFNYAMNHKNGLQLNNEYLDQMVPSTTDLRSEFITLITKTFAKNDLITYMVSKNETNLDYARSDLEQWEAYDNDKGHLKVPKELLCDATRYSENWFSNNQYWVPFLFLCKKSDVQSFDDLLNGISSQNANKFKHEVISSSLTIDSDDLEEQLGTDEVAIMTAARYWEHAYFDSNRWLLFDFTKDWFNYPLMEIKEGIWASRCLTSKSKSIVDKGVTASDFTDIYVGREDDLANNGNSEFLDLETPYEGVPFYKFSDVYEDENGHRWFVLNNAGFNQNGYGDSGFYSELISFDGLTPSADKGCITNLPTRDQAIRAGLWLFGFFNQAVLNFKVDRNSVNQGDMQALGYSIFNILDDCNFDIRMLMQFVRSSKPEYYNREPCALMSIAYRDPKDTSGKQRLIRFIKNSANERKHPYFYIWDAYVNYPDEKTEVYESFAFNNSNIYLQDIADEHYVSMYAKDYYAVQPLFSMDGWEFKNDYPARQSRTKTDQMANDVTNYLYNREKWQNRTFPTDMWNSPVVMFRMTAVYDRGENEHATKTVDGHTLRLLSSRKWEEEDMNLYELISGSIGIWHSNEDALYINGKATPMPSRREVWKQ